MTVRVIPEKASWLHYIFIRLGPLEKPFNFIQCLSYLSCRVAYHTCKTWFIWDVLSPYNTSFSLKNYEKVGIFIPPLQQNSRSLRSIDRSENYTGNIWEMCRIFDVCFIFLSLLVIEIHGKCQIIEKKNQKFRLFR